MKTTAMESQIDALLSSVFQTDTQHAADRVERLLSAFKQAARPSREAGWPLNPIYFSDDTYEN